MTGKEKDDRIKELEKQVEELEAMYVKDTKALQKKLDSYKTKSGKQSGPKSSRGDLLRHV